MSTEVKVPVLPESVSDAIIAKWHKKPGEAVKREENLVDLETDKVVLEVPSPVDGVLGQILQDVGTTVNSQQVIALISEGAVAAAPAPAPATAAPSAPAGSAELAPAARRVAAEAGLDPASIPGTGRGGRVTKEDAVKAATAPKPAPAPAVAPAPIAIPAGARVAERVPMTRLRARIAERMMQSKNSIAMLTSFNEIDMKPVMDLRKKYAESFTEALKLHPIVNASVDGNDIVYHAYQDIGVAVATEKGLVVPVLRNTDTLSLADVERQIAGFAKQAREGGLQLEDLQGGTFTITNGGVFGSLFSTPIVNPPQSAILGMHAIKDRAMVVDGQVVARPMMFVAISYDHRIIDGKDAVQFLVAVKNFLEDPMRLMLHV
ncbi:MAG: dihydrolipoyllysine-residue succinyltransferase [Xanthomonadales bacterium]|nr:dihydrolipoyllysine-residue succinyltransferase [Xanthomonadales bacterium]